MNIYIDICLYVKYMHIKKCICIQRCVKMYIYIICIYANDICIYIYTYLCIALQTCFKVHMYISERKNNICIYALHQRPKESMLVIQANPHQSSFWYFSVSPS